MNEKKIKIKSNPIDWIKLALEKKTEYDKYLEKGDFSDEAFNNLLSKRKCAFMDNTINCIKSFPYVVEKQDYKIELQKNTGTYRLFIPTNIDRSALSWVTPHLCELLDVKIQTDQDKNTFFIRDYDSVTYFCLKNLFIANTEDEFDWKLYNKIITTTQIEDEAKHIIVKIRIFLKMIDTIYARINEETRVYKGNK